MEQTRYWTWTRRRLSGTPRIHPFSPASVAVASYDSWEEQAFAEDAAGGLGGCVWPPRSYSCSFCRREFRSAQALGGHMNVHRRDRARLKQSPPVEKNLHVLHNHQHQQLLQSHPCPTQVDHPPVVCNPNPNKGVDHIPTRSISLITGSNQPNCANLFSPSCVSSPLAQHSSKHLFFSSAPNPTTPLQPVPELKLGGQDMATGGKRGRYANCYQQEKGSAGDHGSTKRQKIDDEGLPSFLNLKSSDDHRLRLRIETVQHHHTSLEELDLELRLGDRPKVKENCSESSA